MGYWRNARSVADEVQELEENVARLSEKNEELTEKLSRAEFDLDLTTGALRELEAMLMNAAPHIPALPETEDLLEYVRVRVAQALDGVQVVGQNTSQP